MLAALGSFLRTFRISLLTLWIAGGSAVAAEFPLTVEFDDGMVAEFGTVMVTESGGALRFEVILNPLVLGIDADLHRMYFNLVGAFTGLGVRTADPVNTLYVLLTDPHVAGGAGSKFDLGVSFGNGAGPKGNGTLQAASFTLFADQPLSIEDLAPMSSTSSGIAIQLAVHVQDTSFVEGVTSETVGGLMGEGDPGEEPSSAQPSSPESEPL